MPEEEINTPELEVLDNNTNNNLSEKLNKRNISNNVGNKIKAGGAVKSTGNLAGKGVQAAGRGMETVGKATNNAGNKVDSVGKRLRERGKNLKNKTSGNTGIIPKKNPMQNASGKGTSQSNEVGESKQPEDKKSLLPKPELDRKDNKSNNSKKNKLSQPLEAIKNKAKKILMMTILPKVLVVFLLIVAFCFILESIFEIFEKINQAGLAVANFHEKLDNYFSGLGFANSEEAFYKEIDKLNKRYHYQLDKTLLMATIFYDDIQNGLDPDDNQTVYGMLDETGSAAQTIFLTIKNWIRESNETVDDKGLVFTSNKIYRLRLLAKNQFATGLFGLAAKRTTSHTVSLKGYIREIGSMLGTQLWDFIKDIPRHIFKLLTAPFDLGESLVQIIKDDEQLYMTDTGQAIKGENIVGDVFDILETIFGSIVNIEKVSISKCADSFDDIEGEDYDIQTDENGSSYKRHICVNYKTYERDDESYFQYLRKHYIRKMPEFKKYLDGLTGEAYDDKIESIINEIKQIAEDYEQYFGETVSGNVVNSDSYKGNIDPLLLNELQQPVVVPEGFEVTFTPPYGKGTTSNGDIHEGLDFNANTTGTKTGDSVYSIYHTGRVIESTADNTYTSSGCTGGCLKIVHKTNLEGVEHDFTVTYSGLDPSTITLKSGDIIGKGDEIGKVGTAEHSEHDIPSVHFTIYYNDTDTYVDPTNLYIPPNKVVLYGNNLAEKIWWALRDEGFSKESTAGVIGNVATETANGNIDNIRVMSTEKGLSFDEIMKSNNLGFGLAGWTWSGFKISFNDYLKYVGGNWYDEDVQIGYLVETVKATTTGNSNSWQNRMWQNRNGSSYDGFINSETPAKAAIDFCWIYENPKIGCPETYDYGKGTERNHRITAAETAYNRFYSATR